MSRDYARYTGWVFALVSATIVWSAKPPLLFSQLAGYLGLERGGNGYRLLTDVGPPLFFTGVVYLLDWTYVHIVWPRAPWTGCKSGWWAYGLRTNYAPKKKHGRYSPWKCWKRDGSKGGGESVEIIGVFYLEHTLTNARITGGMACSRAEALRVDDVDSGDGGWKTRGYWNSDSVWINTSGEPERLSFNYELEATDVYEGELPSNYKGSVRASKRPSSNFVLPGAVESWDGYLQGFRTHSDMSARFYCERVSRESGTFVNRIIAKLPGKSPMDRDRVLATLKDENNTERFLNKTDDL